MLASHGLVARFASVQSYTKRGDARSPVATTRAIAVEDAVHRLAAAGHAGCSGYSSHARSFRLRLS